jgi:starch synthase (maltosyl-transferring)
VERERALYGAWYEFFPRSEGCELDEATGLWKSGTFATAAERLPAVAAMGFDVIYLTPIHPIGTINRKGPNNT